MRSKSFMSVPITAYCLKGANPHGVCATGGHSLHTSITVCCRRRQRGAFRRAPVSSPGQYTRCNSKSKVSDRARSPARARTCYRRSSENPTAFASLRNAVSLLHDKASSSAGLGRYGVSFATRSACAPLHEEHQSRRVARVQVTYCAMPPPNDQFSFATSTRLITTSSARTFNCACMSSTMRL